MPEIIEELTAKDLEICAQIYVDVFTKPPWNQQTNIELGMRRISFLYNSLPNSYGLKAVINEKIIAFLIGYTEPLANRMDFKIREFGVLENYQNQGTGSKMLAFLESQLKQQNIDSISLITYKNASAKLFYEKHGFSVVPKPIMLGKNL